MLYLFDRTIVRQVFTSLCVLGALACIFPVQHPFFQYWRGHAEYVSLAYLFLGLVFFMTHRPRLMLACFGCSAAISFYFFEQMGF